MENKKDLTGLRPEEAGDGETRGLPGRRLRKARLLERVLHPAAESMIRLACEEVLPIGESRILEVLAGPVSLLPLDDAPREVTGLGLRPEELKRNEALRHRVLADLNRLPLLPFRSDCFDGAVLFFGVETFQRPERVFEEVSRVLRAGAVFLIAYSPVTDEACRGSRWERMDDQERLSTIVSYFEGTGSFGPVTAYGTRKRVRSEASRKRHPPQGRPHVWVAFAKNRSAEGRAGDLCGTLDRPFEDESDPFRCPYCGERLKKYEVPHSAYEIDYWYEADFLYICFNDACPYFDRGWQWMWSKMRRNVSYRHMYNPATRKSGPIPVPTVYALRDGIVEDG